MKTVDTSSIDVPTKAEVLVEALPYIQRFRGSTFVIKFGGSFMDEPGARAQVATDAVFLAAVGVKVVLVHGGGKAISRAMEEAGLKPVFKNGFRVTDAEAVEIVGKTLDGETNLSICETIQAKYGRPIGIPGRKVLKAKKMTRDAEGNEIDLGFVGEVTDVDARAIIRALEQGYTPVVSPTACDKEGQLYNVNADIAAGNIAAALNARRLVYLCDVPGLLRDPKDPSTLISTLYSDDVDGLKKEGVISSGMAPKVDSAVAALRSGVRRAHFIDGRVPHSILVEIFTDKGIGTEIVSR